MKTTKILTKHDKDNPAVTASIVRLSPLVKAMAEHDHIHDRHEYARAVAKSYAFAILTPVMLKLDNIDRGISAAFMDEIIKLKAPKTD